jgi:single-stranded-DNA-specific exonuclease
MEWKKRNPVLEPHKRYSITENIARIRGIPKDKIRDFLNPTVKELHSPKLLDNIVKASNIILEAVLKNKRICVSADCDSDGVMSTGIMVRYLRQFTDNIYYIYNQRDKGHGIENQLQFVEDGTDLVIILDSSSNSVKACKQLQDKGMEVVILDHHQIDVENPYATLVNPQNDDYPNKNLSGAGVTFKTIQVMDEKLKSNKVWELVDMCGIGIYGDMMRVDIMENRYLIIQGMKSIKNYGIKAVLEVKNTRLEDVNSQTLGFTIVPLINGCSRMGKIELALQLVMSDDYEECLYLAEELSKLNDERKLIQNRLAEEYSKNTDFNDKILIAIGDTASKSFNGLVATNISQEHQKPTLVMREHKGTLAGSYRTIGDFNVQKFLRKCEYVNSAEGHTFAGGVTLYAKNLQAFKDCINKELASFEFDNVLEYDMEFDVSEITEDLLLDIEKINYLAGQGFPIATFKVTGIIYDKDGRKTMGANNNHVKIQLDDITLIKFNTKSNYASDIPDMAEIEVVGQLNLNIYRTNWGKEYRTNQVLLDGYRIV